MMHKPFVLSIIIGISIFLLLLTGYYFLLLKPSLAAPQASISAQKVLLQQKNMLVQNKLAITQIENLDPLSDEYAISKDRAYQIIKDINDKMSNTTNNPLPSEYKDSELQSRYPQMQDELKAIVIQQYDFVERQKILDEKLGNVFEFFPKREFGSLDPTTDYDQIVTSVDNAFVGIGNITNRLPEAKEPVTQTQESLRHFKDSIQKNPQDYADELNALSEEFTTLKKRLFEIKKGTIQTEEELELLNRQTNLINDYKYFLDKLADQD